MGEDLEKIKRRSGQEAGKLHSSDQTDDGANILIGTSSPTVVNKVDFTKHRINRWDHWYNAWVKFHRRFAKQVFNPSDQPTTLKNYTDATIEGIRGSFPHIGSTDASIGAMHRYIQRLVQSLNFSVSLDQPTHEKMPSPDHPMFPVFSGVLFPSG